VLVSPQFLRTLPAREIKCGLGEIVKYAALNAEIFERIEKHTDKLDNLEFLSSLIFQCIRHKAQVVQADEKENGERKSLNVGHTTGHAIELVCKLSHGESVLWGMKIETEIALENGVCDREYGKKLVAIIDKALQVSPVSTVDFSCVDEMVKRAKSDKKNTEDNQIYMAVAKAKGEWAMLALSEEDYRKNLQKFTR
jgi:3-dehydroquinate synthetase